MALYLELSGENNKYTSYSASQTIKHTTFQTFKNTNDNYFLINHRRYTNPLYYCIKIFMRERKRISEKLFSSKNYIIGGIPSGRSYYTVYCFCVVKMRLCARWEWCGKKGQLGKNISVERNCFLFL